MKVIKKLYDETKIEKLYEERIARIIEFNE